MQNSGQIHTIDKVMIIAPHPDDAELAMGGTIARMIDRGRNVVVVDLTDGEPTPFGTRQLRKQETEKATKILGIQQRICLNMRNRYLRATLSNRRKLAEIIRLYQPDVIFGRAMPDDHPDHVEAARLVEGARFEAKFHKTKLRGEPHWTRRLYFYYSFHRTCHERPTFVIDVSDFWPNKIEAVKAYKSQLRNRQPFGSSLLDRVQITGKYFGQSANCSFAEPFKSPELLSLNLDSL